MLNQTHDVRRKDFPVGNRKWRVTCVYGHVVSAIYLFAINQFQFLFTFQLLITSGRKMSRSKRKGGKFNFFSSTRHIISWIQAKGIGHIIIWAVVWNFSWENRSTLQSKFKFEINFKLFASTNANRHNSTQLQVMSNIYAWTELCKKDFESKWNFPWALIMYHHNENLKFN